MQQGIPSYINFHTHFTNNKTHDYAIYHKCNFLSQNTLVFLKSQKKKKILPMQIYLKLYIFLLRMAVLSVSWSSAYILCKKYICWPREIHLWTKRNTSDILSDWAWCSFLWVSAPILRDIFSFFMLPPNIYPQNSVSVL